MRNVEAGLKNHTWFIPVITLEVKRVMAYRVDFWLRMVISALSRVALAYWLWKAIFEQQGASQIKGYSFEGLMYYYTIVALISNVVYTNFEHFSGEIYNGTLSRYLLYPISFFKYKIATAFSSWLLACVQVFIGLALTIFLVPRPSEVALSATSLVLGIIAVLTSAYLMLMLRSVVELCAFWADKVWSLSVGLYFVTNFLGGALVPLEFFPSWGQRILNYLPFKYLIAFPTKAILGQLSTAAWGESVLIIFVWIVIMTRVSLWILRRGIRQYTAVGI